MPPGHRPPPFRGRTADGSTGHLERQVTVAVEMEGQGGTEMTLAEVRRRTAWSLKGLARDASKQWAEQALPRMRFQLHTDRILLKAEERSVLAAEHLPSVDMVCVPPAFDDSPCS